MKKLLLILLLLPSIYTSAQTTDTADRSLVTGTITDMSGQPLDQASILIRQDCRTAIADCEGNFQINASPGEYINIYKKGYKPESVKVDSSVMNIQLKEIYKNNYHTNQSVWIEQGFIQGFTVDENNEPIVSASVTLVGKPGIGVATGKEGRFKLKVEEDDVIEFSYLGYEKQKIYIEDIKGEITVIMNVAEPDNTKTGMDAASRPHKVDTGKNALVLIDGVEGSIDDVVLEDIVSFSILKDKDKIEKYGEKGENGVVLITTKKKDTK